MVYSNVILQAPNGQTIARIGARRADWYVRRQLADVVLEEGKQSFLTIRLRFEPSGSKNLEEWFYLADKVNQCVVCGTNDNLTKHHIVPRGFRVHFSFKVKDRDSHDVVLMCRNCHDKYETVAWKLKDVLREELGLKEIYNNNCSREYLLYKKVQSYENILKNNTIKLSENRIAEMKNFIRDSGLAGKVISNVPFGKAVVDRLDNLQAFVERWRKHFLSEMKPQFMPVGWDVNKKVRG